MTPEPTAAEQDVADELVADLQSDEFPLWTLEQGDRAGEMIARALAAHRVAMTEPTVVEQSMATRLRQELVDLDRQEIPLEYEHCRLVIAQALVAHRHALTEPTPERVARLAALLDREAIRSCCQAHWQPAVETILRALREDVPRRGDRRVKEL